MPKETKEPPAAVDCHDKKLSVGSVVTMQFRVLQLRTDAQQGQPDVLLQTVDPAMEERGVSSGLPLASYSGFGKLCKLSVWFLLAFIGLWAFSSTSMGESISADYPLRANVWTGCTHWTHMDQGEHQGKFDREWLASLSWNELQSLHADDHEGRVNWDWAVRPQQVQVTQTSMQPIDCPDGKCPYQRKSVAVAQTGSRTYTQRVVVMDRVREAPRFRPLRRILGAPIRLFRRACGC